MAQIELKQVEKRFGAFEAVKPVDLTIKDGEFVVLLGPSGCGKSTVLRSFNRMNELVPSAHAEGEVLFHGQNIYARNTDIIELRRQVGMVFQKSNPFPMSIRDNVTFGPQDCIDECAVDVDCRDDGNECTDDACVTTNAFPVCEHTPISGC